MDREAAGKNSGPDWARVTQALWAASQDIWADSEPSQDAGSEARGGFTAQGLGVTAQGWKE